LGYEKVKSERLQLLLRLVLSGVFIFSAISKLLGPGLFEIALIEQGLATTRAQAAYPARGLIALELFLGVALALPFSLKRLVLPLTTLVLTGFILLQGYQLVFNKVVQDCGCFGALLPMSSKESLLKNFLLLGVSLWLGKSIPPGKPSWRLPAVLAVGCLLFVFLVAPIPDNNEQRFTKFTQFDHAGRVDLNSGDKLVAVFNADCEHCQQAARELDSVRAEIPLPPLYVLIFSESDTALASFATKTGTHFPHHRISLEDFFSLIGNSPPRLYWLQHGRIKAQWDENFAQNLLTVFNPEATTGSSPFRKTGTDQWLKRSKSN